jgi:hypothetical protein
MSSVLEKCSALGPSAGRGALAIAGYCYGRAISSYFANCVSQWQAGYLFVISLEERTEVVLTPQSNEGVVGDGAGGVSIHSKFSSDVDLLILSMME